MASVQTNTDTNRTIRLTAWVESQSISGNYSTIRWKLESTTGNSLYYTVYHIRAWVNGTQVYTIENVSGYNSSGDYVGYAYHNFPVTAGSEEGTINVNHNSDGTCGAVEIKLRGSVGSVNKKTEYTDYVYPSTIARASTPSISAQPTSGSQITIYTNRASSSFTHTISYSFGSKSGTIATGVGASTTWTPPHSLCTEIPNSTSGSGTITCTTYNGSTNIGSKSINFTLTAASSLVPTVTVNSVTDGNNTIAALEWGLFIQGMSYPVIGCTATGIQSSTIKKYSLLCYSGNNVVTTIEDTSLSGLNNKIASQFNKSTQYTYKLKVTDSRQRSSTEQTVSYTITPYASPSIASNLNIYRSDALGVADTSGTYITVSGTGVITSLSNNNPMTVKIGYKLSSDSNYTYTTYYNADTTASSFDFTGQNIKVFSNKETTNSYDIIITLKDQFTTISRTANVGTAFALMDFNENGKAMAIGGYSQAGPNDSKLDILIPVNIKGDVNVIGDYYQNGEPFSGGGGGGDSVPIGLISPYPASTPPHGWLLCDGSAVSRTTYKELFEVIGTSHGSGDGSTTFNLPNIKARVIAGVDTNDTDFNTIGKKGGSKYLQDHWHAYQYGNSAGGDGTGIVYSGNQGTQNGKYGIQGVKGVTTGNSGNLQPYITEYYMIKAFKVSVPGHDLGDTLPIGSVIDYDGDTVPDGYVEVPYGIITAWPTSNITLSSEYSTKTFNNAITIGNSLSLTNGYIVVGSGVHHIKLSATTFFENINVDYVWWFVRKRDTSNNEMDLVGAITNTSHYYFSSSISECVCDVSEGDKLFLRFNKVGSNNPVVRGGQGNTYVTVEVID